MKDVCNFDFEAIQIFYVIFSKRKWVSGVDTYDTYEADIAADSIIWELFARKSAECLNLRNSFTTISSLDKVCTAKSLDVNCKKTKKNHAHIMLGDFLNTPPSP